MPGTIVWDNFMGIHHPDCIGLMEFLRIRHEGIFSWPEKHEQMTLPEIRNHRKALTKALKDMRMWTSAGRFQHKAEVPFFHLNTAHGALDKFVITAIHEKARKGSKKSTFGPTLTNPAHMSPAERKNMANAAKASLQLALQANEKSFRTGSVILVMTELFFGDENTYTCPVGHEFYVVLDHINSKGERHLCLLPHEFIRYDLALSVS